MRALGALVPRIPATDEAVNLAVRLTRATRPGSESVREVRDYVRFGAGPRGSQALVLAAKGRAALRGEAAADVEDVRALGHPCASPPTRPQLPRRGRWGSPRRRFARGAESGRAVRRSQGESRRPVRLGARGPAPARSRVLAAGALRLGELRRHGARAPHRRRTHRRCRSAPTATLARRSRTSEAGVTPP